MRNELSTFTNRARSAAKMRIENQLGYKMMKWISAIEFVETYKTLGKGFGGKNEDYEYFGLLANT